MPFLRETCPICGGRLTLVHAECQDCHTQLTGSAATLAVPPPATDENPAKYGPLARLSREQLDFVTTFLRARGIIKNAEGMLGMSYPAVRSRLDDIVAVLGVPPGVEGASGEMRREQREILTDLAEGRISPSEAHIELRRARQGAAPDQQEGDSPDDGTS